MHLESNHWASERHSSVGNLLYQLRQVDAIIKFLDILMGCDGGLALMDGKLVEGDSVECRP